ncbi:MAG: glycosyltransferase [Candidatus Altiarchaeota archaeon]|nr:glycosyltransferase [Candidatus Altiarchaeota archaeon]
MKLQSYKRIAGPAVVEEIRKRAEKFSDKHVVCVSSTYQGGGVAEILNSLVYLFNDAGVNMGWRILHGTPDFFTITKKFHNGLQGEKIRLSQRKKNIFYETNRRFAKFTHLDHDLVIVHDPQPLPLIDFYKKKQPWIQRCHIDLSSPDPAVWDYLKGFIERYDLFIVSMNEYKKDVKVPQSVVHPAIDPLSPKNEDLPQRKVEKYLSKYGIDTDKPIISQVSRFDKWKDPLGVLKVYEKVRDSEDCRLVLLGSFAADDPEGQAMFEKVEKRVGKSRYADDINLVIGEHNILVNCLQRSSEAVIQKSLREGFGLTVSEALYKRTPVVASRVGGIPLQVVDGVNGFLHDPLDVKGFSGSIVTLLRDEGMRREMGNQGREHVKKNFLITGLMLDYLALFDRFLAQGAI